MAFFISNIFSYLKKGIQEKVQGISYDSSLDKGICH
jgi:hypothetical protein